MPDVQTAQIPERKRRHLKRDNREMMNILHIFGPLNTAATFFITQ